MTDQFWCGNIACFNVTKVQAQYVYLRFLSTVWCFRYLIFVGISPPALKKKLNKNMFSNWMHFCCYVVTVSSHCLCKINKVVDGTFHFVRKKHRLLKWITYVLYLPIYWRYLYVWWFQENEPEGQISQTLKELRNFTLAPPLPDFQVRHLVSELKSTATRSTFYSRCWKAQ